MKLGKLARFFLVFSCVLSCQSVVSADEGLGNKHTVGAGFLLAYEYAEPYFMHLRSGVIAEKNKAENIGALYNFKHSRYLAGFLSEFEFDSSFQYMTQSYWSNGTGTMEDIDVEIYNLRALYGIRLSRKLMVKSGLGYRHLYHYWSGRRSTTGAAGYDREQDYTYIPFIAELGTGNGTFRIEYDDIIDGNNTSYLSQASAVDLKFKNEKGFAVKTSFDLATEYINIEPYYEFLGVENSNIVSGSQEPFNVTHEVGLRVKRELNQRQSWKSYKKLLYSDDYFFGIRGILGEVELGISSSSGGTEIEEQDVGFGLVSGMTLIDGLSNWPISIDAEVAFIKFGQSTIGCDNGDSFITDGRLQNGTFSEGTQVTCAVNDLNIKVNSYSAAFGIKPSVEILDFVHVNGSVGIHRWLQQEVQFGVGTNFTRDNYSGYDSYWGVGLSIEQDNIIFGTEYLKHQMYYDARALTGFLTYNF